MAELTINHLAAFALLVWSISVVVKKYIQFNYEMYFPNVKFEGYYLIPNRKYRVSEITHPGVRNAMIACRITAIGAWVCLLGVVLNYLV